MKPILSATRTYSHKLAKWLEEKLKPLSINEYTITNAFDFADEIPNLSVNEDDILVSYDVIKQRFVASFYRQMLF